MSRIDYDVAASSYDQSPYRAKQLDPHLVAFLSGKALDELRVLELACGTGNQMIANHEAYPSLKMTGCDLSEGMLNEARRKRPDLEWVRGSLTDLPFEDGAGDYVSCQYAFHHVTDKPKAIQELARVTASGGRFVMQNIHPHEMSESLTFQTFPRAHQQDLIDFMRPEIIVKLLRANGFDQVELHTELIKFEVSLGDLLERVSHKMSSSELALLTEREHAEGLEKIRAEISARGEDFIKQDLVVLMSIIADKD